MEAFERISHHFLREVDTDAALGHGFGVPVVCNDGVARRLGVVDVSSRSSHLEIWYIFLHDLVSGSHVFGVWVLFSVCRALDSSGDDLVYGRNAWFDSGYILFVCIGLALGRSPRFST